MAKANMIKKDTYSGGNVLMICGGEWRQMVSGVGKREEL